MRTSVLELELCFAKPNLGNIVKICLHSFSFANTAADEG